MFGIEECSNRTRSPVLETTTSRSSSRRARSPEEGLSNGRPCQVDVIGGIKDLERVVGDVKARPTRALVRFST